MMRDLIKKYWDILGGSVTGLFLSYLVKFQLTKVQLVYSVIILILVCIGVFKIIKQAIDKSIERKKTIFDELVEASRPIKAIRVAQDPMKDGEKIGTLIVDAYEGGKRNMEKLKVFFDKFKGYILTFALALMGLIEAFGGFFNDLLGDKLVVNGINIISVVALVCSAVIGCVSNGYSREQILKIKELFTKPTNKLLTTEIKNAIKSNEVKLKELTKEKSSKEHELSLIENQLVKEKETLAAKKQILVLVPSDITNNEVREITNNIASIELKRNDISNAINNLQKDIDNIHMIINTLRSQK